jgi:hypothetical protein
MFCYTLCHTVFITKKKSRKPLIAKIGLKMGTEPNPRRWEQVKTPVGYTYLCVILLNIVIIQIIYILSHIYSHIRSYIAFTLYKTSPYVYLKFTF